MSQNIIALRCRGLVGSRRRQFAHAARVGRRPAHSTTNALPYANDWSGADMLSPLGSVAESGSVLLPCEAADPISDVAGCTQAVLRLIYGHLRGTDDTVTPADIQALSLGC